MQQERTGTRFSCQECLDVAVGVHAHKALVSRGFNCTATRRRLVEKRLPALNEHRAHVQLVSRGSKRQHKLPLCAARHLVPFREFRLFTPTDPFPRGSELVEEVSCLRESSSVKHMLL